MTDMKGRQADDVGIDSITRNRAHNAGIPEVSTHPWLDKSTSCMDEVAGEGQVNCDQDLRER